MAGALATLSTARTRNRRHRRAAIVVAAAAGAAQEHPAAGAAVASAGLVASMARTRSATATGKASSPRELAAAVAIGTSAALTTRRLWPVAPKEAARIRPAFTPRGGEPGADGNGLTFIVNPKAGPALRGSPTDTLRNAFPSAELLEIGDDLDLDVALEKAAAAARAIGISGGDGTVGAAAAVAHREGRPLVVVPGGTLNHLARDLGIDSVDDAIEAVQDGDLVAVDVATIDGRTFLNTASFGMYTELVDRREQLEDRIGKWPALLVALVQVLGRSAPLEVELDGVRRRLWMIFVGNCQYHPAGFAPSWRERLDDGVLDIRLVDAAARWSRLRLVLAVLTGRLGRCRVYESFTTAQLDVRLVGDTKRLARDGETFDGSERFTIAKESEPLSVYVLRNERPR